MADVQKMARDSVMLNGITPYLKTGGSHYDEGLQKQYFADETRFYADQIGEVASNVYAAQCQGLGSGDWYDWTPVKIRVSPAAIASTGETMPDDWKKLHVLKPLGVDTVPIGAYLTFAGNTWIVYKGRNMGSVMGDGIIRRCNSVINVLDWYGNIVAVPMSYAKMGTLGNASHATENSIVAKNYISCICQLNENSAAFTENTRIILGKTAYSMRGVNDFTREFTDDQDSVHLLTFTIERSAPLPQDSLELQCADYKSFRWDLSATAPAAIVRGNSAQINVKSIRMGQTVQSTTEHPISYMYTSNKIGVSVDENGLVTTLPGTTAGTAKITVALQQNPNIRTEIEIKIVASIISTQVLFTSTVPDTLKETETATIQAFLFTGNGQSVRPLTLEASGPSDKCYSIESAGFNTWKITCWAASNIPLTLTANDQYGNSVTAQIILTT